MPNDTLRGLATKMQELAMKTEQMSYAIDQAVEEIYKAQVDLGTEIQDPAIYEETYLRLADMSQLASEASQHLLEGTKRLGESADAANASEISVQTKQPEVMVDPSMDMGFDGLEVYEEMEDVI